MVYRRLIRPLLFRLDPETAHGLAMQALRLAGWGPFPRGLRKLVAPQGRAVEHLGLRFPGRLGVAAGFDKDARALAGLFGLGFGFAEVGSVTARPWPGNPRPRLFRLPADGALVNRLGLPSEGAVAVARRLRRVVGDSGPRFPVFVNIAKTANPAVLGDAAVADIRYSVEQLAPVADALVLNLSCPNTADGRTFQSPEALRELLAAVRPVAGPRPVLAKISPDLDSPALEAVVEEALRGGVAGFVAANTTRSRDGLRTPLRPAIEAGGLSGTPLRARALAAVRVVRRVAPAGTLVVGCGGVRTPADIAAFLDAGADLVEAYTGFVYEGPLFCRRVLASSCAP